MTPHQRHSLHDALSRLAEGERSAFDEVYAALWPLVRRFTLKALGDGDEDVAQDVLLRIFEQASDFDPDRGDAAAWALSIAAWQCKTERKRRQRRREDPDTRIPEQLCHNPDPEDLTIERAMLAAARDTLDTLRPSDIETITDRLEGRRADQIPGATARKRVQRALDRLRGAWRRRYGAP